MDVLEVPCWSCSNLDRVFLMDVRPTPTAVASCRMLNGVGRSPEVQVDSKIYTGRSNGAHWRIATSRASDPAVRCEYNLHQLVGTAAHAWRSRCLAAVRASLYAAPLLLGAAAGARGGRGG